MTKKLQIVEKFAGGETSVANQTAARPICPRKKTLVRTRASECIRASMPASDEGARAMHTRGRAHRVPNLCRGERRRHTEGRART